MYKQKVFIIGLLVLGLWMAGAFPLYAQRDSLQFTLTTTLTGSYRFFTTDKLQQVYAVTADNTVIKFAANGREQFRYNNNTLGQLTLIDATNPFNLLLFYPDFLTAITLDRTLSETGQLILSELGIIFPSQIAIGNDNHLWVYDQADFQLKKITLDGRIVTKSDNLAFLLGKTPQPIGMSSRENAVFLNDPNLGILVFDNFCQYNQTLPLTGISNFQILEKKLVYQKEKHTYLFDRQSLLTTKLNLPADLTHSAVQLEIQKNLLFVLTETGIHIYTFGKE